MAIYEQDEDELRRQALMEQLGGGDQLPQAGLATAPAGAARYSADRPPEADARLMAPPDIAPRGPQIDRGGLGQGPDVIQDVLPRRGQDSTMPVPDLAQGGGGAERAAISLTRPDQYRDDSGQGIYGGFDFDKEYDLGGSAKGTFFYASGAGAEDPRWRNAATSADWFNEYVRPAMEQQGFQIGEVRGDKAFVHTRENPEGTWIDWVKNIDGDPAKGEMPQLVWQDLSYSNTGGPAAGGGGPVGPTSMDQLGNNDALAQIIAQINALSQGGEEGESPAYRQALMQLLQGGQ